MRKKFLFGIVFVLCIIIAPGQIYVQKKNLWITYLTQNAENLLLLFRDGELIVITEYLTDQVAFPWDKIFRRQTPKDLLIVIHNHLGLERMSMADKALYYRLQKAGFKGYFLCRLLNGTVISMED